MTGQHGQPTPTSLGQGYICIFGCNLPPAFLAEWPGSFTRHCGYTRVEGTPNKSQHGQLILERQILPSLQPRIKPAACRARVRWSTLCLLCLLFSPATGLVLSLFRCLTRAGLLNTVFDSLLIAISSMKGRCSICPKTCSVQSVMEQRPRFVTFVLDNVPGL